MAVDTGADAARASLVAALRRFQPAKVRAVLSETDARDIAVSARRRKWERVAEVLDSMPWTRVECLDKSGALLGLVHGEEAGDRVADDVRALVPKEYAFGELILRAARESRDAARAEMAELVGGYRDLAALLVERLAGLEKSIGGVLAMLHDATIVMARGEAAAQQQAEQALNPDLLAQQVMLGVAQKAGMLPAPPAKPNGTTK